MSNDPDFENPLGDEPAQDERGASIVEYAFLVLLIALIAITSVRFFGEELSTSFSTIADTLANPSN